MIVQFTNEAVKCGLGGMSITTVFSQLMTSPRSSNASFSSVSVSETTLQAATGVAREAYRVKSSAKDGSEALSFLAILPTSDTYKLKSSDVASEGGKPMSCTCSVFIPVKRMGVCNFSPIG